MEDLRDKYEVVIGLEVHAQLKTKSKIFAPDGCEFGKEPNSETSPITLGMPGVLPVLNKECVNMGILTGLALNCEIPERCKFDRKQYFYPDLPKGYQISQYDEPICVNGYINVKGKRIGITRAHLEEDAGKLVHVGAAGINGATYSLVDLNRAGTPLLEIVSEPDMRSSEEARNYMEELRDIVRYLGVCDGNLEEGSMRCDANISIMPKGSKEFGTRAEIKNVNSFSALQRAIEYEIDRQIEIVEEGGQVVQETRLWDDNLKENKVEITDTKLTPENLAELISLIEKGTISNNIGKQILVEDMITNGEKASAIVERKGLSQISDEGAIKAVVEKVVNSHPKEIEAYKNGKTNLLGFFVGQVMKETKGRANPKTVNELVRQILEA